MVPPSLQAHRAETLVDCLPRARGFARAGQFAIPNGTQLFGRWGWELRIAHDLTVGLQNPVVKT